MSSKSTFEQCCFSKHVRDPVRHGYVAWRSRAKARLLLRIFFCTVMGHEAYEIFVFVVEPVRISSQ